MSAETASVNPAACSGVVLGMTREEMAVELLRALDGAELAPRDCVPGQEMFDDVPASSPFCPFIAR